MLLQLKRPCSECPFKNDIAHQRGWLGKRRAETLIKDLYERDRSFVCHKTIGLDYAKQQHCAGAMILLEREERANQIMRIGERTGFYDRNKLVMNGPVFDNPQQFIDWHSGSEVVTEYQERQRRAAEAEANKLEVVQIEDVAEDAKAWLKEKNGSMDAFLKDLEQKGIQRRSMAVKE